MHAAFVGFGNQPWVLRLPAFVAGVLLVPATFALTNLLFGSRAAFFSAVLTAVSSYLVEYSTNARGYTLQALCFVVMLSLVVVAVRGDSPTALLLAVAVAALGAYAVPTMLYGVAVAAAWLLLELRRTPMQRIHCQHLVASGFVLGLVVALLYLPVSIVSGPDKLVTNRFVVPLGLGELASELPRSLAQTWAFLNRDVPWPATGLLVTGFAIATVTDLRTRRWPLGVLAPVTCLVLILIQRVAPFERVWLFLLPLYFTLSAGGLSRFVDGRWLGIGFGVVLGYFTLTSGSILSSTETGVFPDAEAVTQTLAPRLAPDDAVMTALPASLPELQYYFPRYGLPIDVLVRSADDAQNLWVIEVAGAQPHISGWSAAEHVASFPTAELFKVAPTPTR
jgi:4-amino-4-deoxy-L-arabinose transferase-like glycosyltransferase